MHTPCSSTLLSSSHLLGVCELFFLFCFVFLHLVREKKKFRRIDWFSCISNDAVEIIFDFYAKLCSDSCFMCVYVLYSFAFMKSTLDGLLLCKSPRHPNDFFLLCIALHLWCEANLFFFRVKNRFFPDILSSVDSALKMCFP